MKISKIFAGMSAMAIASAMVISASANTLTVANPSAKEWDGFAKYTNAEGKEDNDIVWGGSLTKDSDLSMTINFDWTDKAKEEKFCSFKVGYANGWDSIFTDEAPEGWVESSEDTDEDGNRLDADGNTCDYAWQNDGWLQVYNTELSSVTVKIPASAVNTIYDNASAEEGFDGIIVQVGNNGLTINSIDFDQDVKWFSEQQAEAAANTESKTESAGESKADDSKAADSSKADDSKSDSSKAADSSKASTTTTKTTTTTTTSAAASSAAASDDTNQATGATTGLALAGLALAGAVAVVSKRK